MANIKIHPTAIVSPDAQIASDVEIGAYCVVDGKVEIGEGTILRPFSRVCDYTKIGKNCRIHEHAVIGGPPQDLSYKGEITWAILGDGVTCREYVTINRATGEGETTEIGDGCFIMENVHCAHNVKTGKGCTIANKNGIAGHVHIGDYAVIGGMSGFHQFVHIGSYCMVGGMSRLTQDIPPFMMAVGAPIRVYDINKVGLRRRGFDQTQRTKIHNLYKKIYDEGLLFKEAIAEIEREFPTDPEARLIIDFARSTIRGFAPRFTREAKKSATDEELA